MIDFVYIHISTLLSRVFFALVERRRKKQNRRRTCVKGGLRMRKYCDILMYFSRLVVCIQLSEIGRANRGHADL